MTFANNWRHLLSRQRWKWVKPFSQCYLYKRSSFPLSLVESYSRYCSKEVGGRSFICCIKWRRKVVGRKWMNQLREVYFRSVYLNPDRPKCTCVPIWILTDSSVPVKCPLESWLAQVYLGITYLNPDWHKCTWEVLILILNSTCVLVCLFESWPKQEYLKSVYLNPNQHMCTCGVPIWILTGTSVLGSSCLNPDRHMCARGMPIWILTGASVLVSSYLNPDQHNCTWEVSVWIFTRPKSIYEIPVRIFTRLIVSTFM